MSQPYTPFCPTELREAFDNSPVMKRAYEARARLEAAGTDSPYCRASELLAKLDAAISKAEAEWPIITGSAPQCSNLHSWLAWWGAAIDGACWGHENPRAADSYIAPQVAA